MMRVHKGLFAAVLLLGAGTSTVDPSHATAARLDQARNEALPAAHRPRLVVVLVVDQLRPDYLYRFREHFGTGGFNRFLEDGAVFTDARYEHAVTKTCAGHAVVLSGSHAATNGIIANTWYDRELGHEVYCARDDDAPLLGVDGEGRSPRRLRVSTIGDELRVATGGRARVVSVAAKDRAAIMLGGHLTADTYWLEGTQVTSSTYYRSSLPDWVLEFNASDPVRRYFHTSWERILPAAAYDTMGPDDVAYETDGAGLGSTFPHRIGAAGGPESGLIDAFEHSPFPNEVVVDLAVRALKAEGLGADQVPDVLAVGLSANDWVGHWFGPNSHEVLDVTVRTDRQIARLFAALDRHVGLEHVVAVLTADHGVAPLPETVQALSGATTPYRVHPRVVEDALTTALDSAWNAAPEGGWIIHHDAPYIYLNETGIASLGIVISDVEDAAADALRSLDVVHAVHTATDMSGPTAGLPRDIMLSFHSRHSGNILYTTRPYTLIDDEPTGTSHGSSWSYDAHVPLLWLGPAVQPGTRHGRASVADIAPTLSTILGIVQPAASTGRVLGEILSTQPHSQHRTSDGARPLPRP